MNTVPYDDMKFYFVTNHYDYHLSGTCIHNGRIALFESHDETDYQLMNDTCPCCKDGGTDDYKDCHCENAPNVYCYITELPFLQRIRYRLRPYYSLIAHYIRNYGIRMGLYYWSRWFYGTSTRPGQVRWHWLTSENRIK